jgi:hypothetical protein
MSHLTPVITIVIIAALVGFLFYHKSLLSHAITLLREDMANLQVRIDKYMSSLR